MLRANQYKGACSSCGEVTDVINMKRPQFNTIAYINLCSDCMIQIYEMLHTMEYKHLNQSAELKKQGRVYNDTNIKN